jgi:hypothetical protein
MVNTEYFADKMELEKVALNTKILQQGSVKRCTNESKIPCPESAAGPELREPESVPATGGS